MIRRAGSRWRLLVHDVIKGQQMYGTAHDVASHPIGNGLSDFSTEVVYPDTEFDELVVGRFIHIEQMDTGSWWMSIANITIDVRVDRDGRPTSVLVQGPGDCDDPFPGCEYRLIWSAEDKIKGEK